MKSQDASSQTKLIDSYALIFREITICLSFTTTIPIPSIRWPFQNFQGCQRSILQLRAKITTIYHPRSKPIDDKKRHKRRSSNHHQHCLHCLRHHSFHADPLVNGNQINDTVTGPSIPRMNFRPYYQLGYVLSSIKNLQNLNIPTLPSMPTSMQC